MLLSPFKPSHILLQLSLFWLWPIYVPCKATGVHWSCEQQTHQPTHPHLSHTVSCLPLLPSKRRCRPGVRSTRLRGKKKNFILYIELSEKKKSQPSEPQSLHHPARRPPPHPPPHPPFSSHTVFNLIWTSLFMGCHSTALRCLLLVQQLDQCGQTAAQSLIYWLYIFIIFTLFENRMCTLWIYNFPLSEGHWLFKIRLIGHMPHSNWVVFNAEINFFVISCFIWDVCRRQVGVPSVKQAYIIWPIHIPMLSQANPLKTMDRWTDRHLIT